jgi:hypothetical protein
MHPCPKPIGPYKYLADIPLRSSIRVSASCDNRANLAMPTESFSRWPGPDVIVVAPDGRQWRECGVESPHSTMARVNATVPAL